MPYIVDPNNPGWLLKEGADASQESSWWQIPEGFVADPANPGWYYREGADAAQAENWVHDPSIEDAPAAVTGITVERITGTVAAKYTATPQGVILHGSRSGSNNDAMAEYRGTARYAGSGIELGWSATVGPGIYAVHMPATHYGWNARAASSKFLAIEFAQATINHPIDDSMVDAFVHWLRTEALPVWPNLPMHFPSHAEVEVAGLTGARDGKSDVYPGGDARLEDLRRRIGERLGFEPGPAVDVVPPSAPSILDATGRDIGPWMQSAAAEAGIPLVLLLGCAYAESGESLNPNAERWGRETPAAQDAIARGDWDELAAITARAGNDISFGLAQFIVRFNPHLPDQRAVTVENALALREYVWTHTEEDIRQMALKLRNCLERAGTQSPPGVDPILGACVLYNVGNTMPPAGDAYWSGPKAARYRECLAKARAVLGG